MVKKKAASDEFIFRENQNGELEFVGDFNGLYISNVDPWRQSADGDLDYQKYYDLSRTKLANAVKNIKSKKTILEIGCGTGFVLNFLATNLTNSSLSGIDISAVAIERAQKKFPEYNFEVGNIQSSEFIVQKKYDIVIFNQLLWYILENIETAFINAHKLLRPGGHFLLSNAFLKEKQRFGADIINGFSGCKEFIETRHGQLFSLVDSQFDHPSDLKFNDGLLIYRKLVF